VPDALCDTRLPIPHILHFQVSYNTKEWALWRVHAEMRKGRGSVDLPEIEWLM